MADKISVSIELCSLLSFVLALTFLSSAVVIVYNLLEKEEIGENKLRKIMLFLISFLMVFNYLAVEYIYFFEACMMALGIFLSVLAVKTIIIEEKYAYIKSLLLLIIGVFCYQGSIAVFPMLLLTYFVLFKRNNIKEVVITIAKSALMYGFAMLLTILFSNLLFQNTRIQMGELVLNLETIGDALYCLVIESLNVLPIYMHLAILILTSIILCFNKNDKIKLLLGYWVTVLASIIICIMPIITGSGIGLEIRTCYAFGITIGISCLFILYTSQNAVESASRFLTIISYTLIILLFITNMVIYIVVTNQHIMVNKLDEANCQIIKKYIEEYEKATNIQVTRIAAIIKGEGNEYYPGCLEIGDMTQSALNTWSVREAIDFYIGRWLKFAPITIEQFLDFFGDKTWNSFSKDQIHIEGEVLYFCGN